MLVLTFISKFYHKFLSFQILYFCWYYTFVMILMLNFNELHNLQKFNGCSFKEKLYLNLTYLNIPIVYIIIAYIQYHKIPMYIKLYTEQVQAFKGWTVTLKICSGDFWVKNEDCSLLFIVWVFLQRFEISLCVLAHLNKNTVHVFLPLGIKNALRSTLWTYKLILKDSMFWTAHS